MGDMHKALFLGKFQVGGGGSGTSDVQDLVLTMDSLTYVITAYLVDGNGTRIGTERTIDIPLESTIVGASYDDSTKDLTFTLTSGSTLTVPLDDIIYGLQPLIDSTHKLSADLVDDSTSTNKLAHVDNAGGLWIGSAQYIKIMDSASYEALATKDNMIYMVYPTPTPTPSLNASPRSETLDITPIEREDIRLDPMEGVETKIGEENELTVEGGDDNANLQRDNRTD